MRQLWLKSGSQGGDQWCPFHPHQQTSSASKLMSA